MADLETMKEMLDRSEITPMSDQSKVPPRRAKESFAEWTLRVALCPVCAKDVLRRDPQNPRGMSCDYCEKEYRP
jgi:hypothetical protein